MEVWMLRDWHGVHEAVTIQRMLLDKEMRSEGKMPQRTAVLHEALPSDFMNGGYWRMDRSSPLYSDHSAANLEWHWGPSEPYADLFKYLGRNGFNLAGLDHSLDERRALAKGFGQLVQDHRAGKRDADRARRLATLKRDVCLKREEIFCASVEKAAENGFDLAVVVTHPGHIERCKSYLGKTDGHGVSVLDGEAPFYADRLGKAEDEIQIEFAKRKAIPPQELPLVPAVTLGWNLQFNGSKR